MSQPRASVADRSAPPDLGHRRVAIVGAGFAGLGLAAKLTAAGIDDVVILERADAVGGVWRDNTYPGCACDVPSHLYSLSFAPNPSWRRSYSSQPDIQAYLEGFADRFGLREHLLLGHDVRAAAWDAGAGRWAVRTSGGDLTADVFVWATGGLSAPAAPDVAGLADFEGDVFHSARWDHGVDLAGRRVAVVGTGASAIQFVPEIAPVAGRLYLFQRTPPWVMARRDRAISDTEQALFQRVPLARRLVRLGQFVKRELRVVALVHQPALLTIPQYRVRRHLGRQVPDPELRAKLTPSYRLGCKRVLLSDNYYPALRRDNVELVASGVRALTARTVVAADGTEREVDVVIFGTGFDVGNLAGAERVRGLDGVSLRDAWLKSGRQALRATTVGGFPNLFVMTGPNSGLGHTSMIHIMESQFAYVLAGLRLIEATGQPLDPRLEAQSRWDERVRRRMAGTVWSVGGCRSWYLDETGKNSALWPGSTIRFRRATRRVDQGEYRSELRRPAGAGATEGGSGDGVATGDDR